MKPKNFIKLIQTKRLCLKPMPKTKNMADKVFSIISKQRGHLKFMGFANMKTAEQVYKEFISTSADLWKSKTVANYGIFLRSSNVFIGCISVDEISWDSANLGIGWWLDKNYSGKGYASEAAQAVINTFFSFGFHKLYVNISDKNKQSMKLAKKLGFKKEGLLRDHWFNPNTQKYENSVVYGLINPNN